MSRRSGEAEAEASTSPLPLPLALLNVASRLSRLAPRARLLALLEAIKAVAASERTVPGGGGAGGCREEGKGAGTGAAAAVGIA